MAGDTIGRKAVLTINGSTVASGRTTSMTINNTTINVTGDDDDGIQKLLTDIGEKSVEFSYEGLRLLADTTLLDLSLTASPVAAIVLTVADTYTITGSFMMGSYAETMPYNEAMTFTASFSSSGAIVKAAV